LRLWGTSTSFGQAPKQNNAKRTMVFLCSKQNTTKRQWFPYVLKQNTTKKQWRSYVPKQNTTKTMFFLRFLIKTLQKKTMAFLRS